MPFNKSFGEKNIFGIEKSSLDGMICHSSTSARVDICSGWCTILPTPLETGFSTGISDLMYIGKGFMLRSN